MSKTPLRHRIPARLALAGIACCLAGLSNAATATAGDYQRVVLVSWDGVRRDVLDSLLDVADPMQPCWNGSTVMPVSTGRPGSHGDPGYTCLPALAGLKPAGVPAESPSYAPFQVIASHTTDDGETMTKPQHASMLTGYSTTAHGVTTNVSSSRLPAGITLYERLMDAFDPVPPLGKRNGYILRTLHSADKKFVGTSVTYWAKKNRALQTATGHGNDDGDRPGALTFADKAFAKWKKDAVTRGLPDPGFFVFLHFKSTDWAGHLGGSNSANYRAAIVATDRKLYSLLEMLRRYGWSDAAVLVSTDHGFGNIQHSRIDGRTVINTWMAAYNVHLSVDELPLRTFADYCAAHNDPAACLAGPPMPDEDVVPNAYVTDIAPTILDMFGVEWQTNTEIDGVSLYRP